MITKRTIRLDAKLAERISQMGNEKRKSENAIIEDALKFYMDYVYMQEHAMVIPQEIIKVLQATVAVMEQRLNNKTNQVLSALAIEVGTLEQVIAKSLDVSKTEVQQYRKNSVDYLKANQRVFRLDEVVE